MDPIVTLIPTYKEGELVQGAIRSVSAVAELVIVFDGTTDPEIEIQGEETDVGEYVPDIFIRGSWESEAQKRNEMLSAARGFFGGRDFWILNVDADEYIVWPEALPDYLSVLNPGEESEENIPAFRRTEGVYVPLPPFPPIHNDKTSRQQWHRDMRTHLEKWAHRQPGLFTDYAPSRLYHSTLISEYVVSSWRIKTPAGYELALTHNISEFPPIYGEPHMHHRTYLRRGERTQYRASVQGEEARYMRDHGIEPAKFSVESN